MQLVYLDMLLAPSPFSIEPPNCVNAKPSRAAQAYDRQLSYEDLRQKTKVFFNSYEGRELCRSNVLSINILPEGDSGGFPQ